MTREPEAAGSRPAGIHHPGEPAEHDGEVRGALVEATRPARPGTQLSLLVLAASAGGCAGVDLDSGALVRARYPWSADDDLAPYDVVSVALAEGEADPSAPEAAPVVDLPVRTGRLSARRAERWLRPFVHPHGEHLLGFAGPAVPFWTLSGSRPSMALVPARPVVVAAPDGPRCRFVWRRLVHELPVTDRRLADVLARVERRGPIAERLLEVALGWRPTRFLVALTPPHDGHCYKVVVSLLPR